MAYVVRFGYTVFKRPDYFMAVAQPTGITVYAESPEAAESRLHDAMRFVASTLRDFSPERLKAYFEKHGVDYDEVTLSRSDVVEPELVRL